MKISCFGSRVSCSFRKALRAAATSGRSCSAACTLFFKGQVDVVEEPRNPRLAHLHLFFRQANLKLCKRTIRLFRYKLLNPICMWLKREVLYPPNLSGLTLPVSRLRLMNPPTVLKAMLYSSATFTRL